MDHVLLFLAIETGILLVLSSYIIVQSRKTPDQIKKMLLGGCALMVVACLLSFLRYFNLIPYDMVYINGITMRAGTITLLIHTIVHQRL